MSINGATPAQGATTYVAPTGGAEGILQANGDSQKLVARFASDTEFLTARTIDFTVKEPVVSVSAPNGYTQARRKALLKFPLELDNGNRTVNTMSIELAVDMETTTSEIQEYCFLASQIIGDDDYANLWRLGFLE